MKGDFDAFGFNGCRIPASFISPMNYKKSRNTLAKRGKWAYPKKMFPNNLFCRVKFSKIILN